MTEFVALYRGRTVSEAELVALSAQPEIVRKFFDEMTGRGTRPKGSSEQVERESLRVVPGGDED